MLIIWVGDQRLQRRGDETEHSLAVGGISICEEFLEHEPCDHSRLTLNEATKVLHALPDNSAKSPVMPQNPGQCTLTLIYVQTSKNNSSCTIVIADASQPLKGTVTQLERLQLEGTLQRDRTSQIFPILLCGCCDTERGVALLVTSNTGKDNISRTVALQATTVFLDIPVLGRVLSFVANVGKSFQGLTGDYNTR